MYQSIKERAMYRACDGVLPGVAFQSSRSSSTQQETNGVPLTMNEKHVLVEFGTQERKVLSDKKRWFSC